MGEVDTSSEESLRAPRPATCQWSSLLKPANPLGLMIPPSLLQVVLLAAVYLELLATAALDAE